MEAFRGAPDRPPVIDDEGGKTPSSFGSEGCVSVGHEDLRVRMRVVVNPILPEVFIYLERSQRPEELQLERVSFGLPGDPKPRDEGGEPEFEDRPGHREAGLRGALPGVRLCREQLGGKVG